MLNWAKSLRAWRVDHEAGAYAYLENTVTGARKAVRVISGGYSPLDRRWLERLPYAQPVPPRGGSGVRFAK